MRPRTLLGLAFALAALRAAAWWAGLDAWTSVLSGTAPPGVSFAAAWVVGPAMVVLHLAAVTFAPTFALAAVILLTWSRLAPFDEGPRDDRRP